METFKNTNLQNLEEEKEEEALSLRDLPLKPSSTTTTTTTEDHRDSTTDPFEFLTSTSHDVSPAENIIFDGKVIPLNHQNALLSPPENINPRVRARSESLPATRGHTMARDNAELMRTSRSLNYCKLPSVPTTVHSPPENSFPAKNTARHEATSFSGSGKCVRPRRWYVIMFGMVRFPAEIELKDIKNRQIRRNIPSVMFPSPAKQQRSPSPSRSTTPWRFLNALSCKEPTSVAATAPFRMPYA